MESPKRNRASLTLLLVLTLTLSSFSKAQDLHSSSDLKLELSRPIRPWEFQSATGTRAALFGNEAGQLEAWVYPLKILRDFHLRFHLQGMDLPADSLVPSPSIQNQPPSCMRVTPSRSGRLYLFRFMSLERSSNLKLKLRNRWRSRRDSNVIFNWNGPEQ